MIKKTNQTKPEIINYETFGNLIQDNNLKTSRFMQILIALEIYQQTENN